MESSGQRRLAAIMFTDMVGYSALTQRDEAQAMRLLTEHFELLRLIFPTFEGNEVKTIGDAFLVEFSSALQAAKCAIAIQKALWERNQKLPEGETPIVLRIGLHVGDVIHSGGDVFGDGVNIAARLEPCAPPGGICMSEDMARSVRNKLDVPLVELAEKELKNITERVKIYRVELPWLPSEAAGSGAGDEATVLARLKQQLQNLGSLRYGVPAAVGLVLLAVFLTLNFPRSAGEPRDEALALLPLGYTGPSSKTTTAKMLPALLVESLRESPGLVVAPFESSRQFSPEEDFSQVSREMNVEWVLRGDVAIQENEGSYGLSLELLGGEKPGWNKRLEGDLEQLYSAAEGLTTEIEQALKVKSATSTVINRNPKAIQAYLEGKALLEGWDAPASFESARAAFSRATELEPDFGEAYAGLALANWGIWEQDRNAGMVKPALDAAEKAVSLAPNHPEAHLALGVIRLGRGNSTEAVQSFEEARKLAPADDAVCRRIAETYSKLGRLQKAEEMFQLAIDLRPDFWENYRTKGNFYYNQGRYEDAKKLYREIVRLRPTSDIGYNNLGVAHLTLGELDEAEQNFKQAQSVQPTLATSSNLGFIYYTRGDYEAAAEQFRSAAEMGSSEIPWVNLGDAYRQLKQVEEAKAAYQKAAAMSLERLQVNPTDSVARSWLAYALSASGRCEAATREASEALSQEQDQPTIHYYAGLAYALCARDEEAAQQIEIAAKGGLAVDIRTNPDLRRFLERPRIKALVGPDES